MVAKKIFIKALFITLGILFMIYAINFYMNVKREEVVLERMTQILDEYQEIQALSLMTTTFGTEISCVSLGNSLSHMDKTLWDTGIKIDRYREAKQQFVTDPFYVDQKKKFNRNEVIYLSLLRDMKEKCDINQTLILFFFKKKEDCPDCDAQSFVLTDINKDIDPEIAIFSFDANLELPSINTLQAYYNITTYPCIVVDDKKYCGLKNKGRVVEILCKNRGHSNCP